MECLLPYLRMVTVPHIMVGLERMLDYRGVRLARFHCIHILLHLVIHYHPLNYSVIHMHMFQLTYVRTYVCVVHSTYHIIHTLNSR